MRRLASATVLKGVVTRIFAAAAVAVGCRGRVPRNGG